MPDFFQNLFNTAGFPPRWFCGSAWTDSLGALHIISDIAIFGAYFFISVILAYSIFIKKDIPSSHIIWLFVTFILFCGFNHLLEAVIFWQPVYRFSGLVKMLTAIVSWATVFALIFVLPKIVKALKEQAEKRFQLIIEELPISLFVTDNKWNIQYVNRATENLFTDERINFLGEDCKKLFSEDLEDALNKYNDNIEFSAGICGIHKDNILFPASISAHNLGEGNDALKIIAVRDKTYAKQAADEERENYVKQLEKTNDQLQEYTSVISHDLKEPLRTLISFSELLEVDAGPDLPEQAKEDLQFIHKAAQRMQNLVNDLLAYAKQGGEFEFKKVSLKNCLEKAKTSLENTLNNSGVKINNAEVPDVMGNELLLTQVFQNLIDNANKFSDKDNPEINISAEMIDGRWTISIADNGIGMDEKYLELIFKPFSRLNTKEKYEGSGIGLAFCHKIITQHNGKIWAESEIGKGTQMKFTLQPVTAE